jgi:hypothetical protein
MSRHNELEVYDKLYMSHVRLEGPHFKKLINMIVAFLPKLDKSYKTYKAYQKQNIKIGR